MSATTYHATPVPVAQDTAEVYPVVPRAETSGATSRIIGTWLRQRKREEFVIASKVAGVLLLCLLCHQLPQNKPLDCNPLDGVVKEVRVHRHINSSDI